MQKTGRYQDDDRDGREDRGIDELGVGEVLDRVEATALERITRGEVDMQVATAKRYPRSISKFRESALSMATQDAETAGACFYVLPRGGKNIEGPGVRLAEIVATCWGNIRAETRIVDEGEKFVTAQATVWDLERNVLIRVETQRRITDRNGHRYNDDMILVTSNAASSIALRNAVFRVVPGAYVKSIYEAARKVAVGDAKTLVDRRAAAIAWFGKAGVQPDRVLAVLGKRSVEDVDLSDLATLQGLRTAIMDGSATVDDAFPTAAPVPPENGQHKVATKKDAQKAAASKTELEQKSETQTKPVGPDELNF